MESEGSPRATVTVRPYYSTTVPALRLRGGISCNVLAGDRDATVEPSRNAITKAFMYSTHTLARAMRYHRVMAHCPYAPASFLCRNLVEF